MMRAMRGVFMRLRRWLQGLQSFEGFVATKLVLTFTDFHVLDMFGGLCRCKVQEAVLELVDLLLGEFEMRCHQALAGTHGLLKLCESAATGRREWLICSMMPVWES